MLERATKRAAPPAGAVAAGSSDVETFPDASKSSLSRVPGRAGSDTRHACRGRRVPKSLRLLALGLLAALAAAAPAGAARVVILQMSDTPRLTRTLSALQGRAGIPFEVVRIGNRDSAAWDAALATRERPALVVALGLHASSFLAARPPASPSVHCLAGEDALRAGAPSVPSAVPPDLQAAWLRRLVPAAKTIGLAFDPASNTLRAETLAVSLRAAGYKTLMTPVSTPSEIPAALDHIAQRADVLLALPDSTVYTSESARGVLLQSFRRNTPVIGPNDAWVRMGALYALDWDYEEVGAACAQLALRALQGPRSAVAPPAPLRPRVFVNQRSAAQFGLRWDADVLRGVEPPHE